MRTQKISPKRFFLRPHTDTGAVRLPDPSAHTDMSVVHVLLGAFGNQPTDGCLGRLDEASGA